MKKTFNINVAGFPFIIDDDAYSLLNDYLVTIEHAFTKNEEGVEIAQDIESRVAELLLECSAEGSPIITAMDVEKVIERVGKPEEMIEEADSDSSIPPESGTNEEKEGGFSATPPPYIPPLPPVKKKFFRDPQNAMLGGVCAGLAWYLKADPTAVRLVTLLITILSVATGGLAYLILWIVIPEARTPLERMQMMGEQPTVENIGKTVTDSFRDDSGQTGMQTSNTARNGFWQALTGICSVIAKALILFGMIIAMIILVSLVIGLLGCIFALIMFGTSWGGTMFGEISPLWDHSGWGWPGNVPIYGVVCGIGGILTLGIPLFMLVRKGWRNARPLSSSARTSLIIVWIIGFITCAFAAGRIINLAYEAEVEEHKRWEQRYQQSHAIEEPHDNTVDSLVKENPEPADSVESADPVKLNL